MWPGVWEYSLEPGGSSMVRNERPSLLPNPHPHNPAVSHSLPERGLMSRRRGMRKRGRRGRFSHTLVASGHFELLQTRAEKGDLASALPWFTVFSFMSAHFLYLLME